MLRVWYQSWFGNEPCRVKGRGIPCGVAYVSDFTLKSLIHKLTEAIMHTYATLEPQDSESTFSEISRSDRGIVREILASPLLIRNDRNELYLVVVSVSGVVKMYDGGSGSEIWSIEIAPGRTSIYRMANVRTRAEASSIQATLHSPILDSDRGRIILSDLSGLIVCIRAQDGKTIWKRDLGDRDIYTIKLLGRPEYVQKSGTLLVPLTNRSLVELDVEKGHLKRTWNLSDRIMSSPVSMVHTQLQDEMTIYVVSWDGIVRAINEKSGEVRWDVDLGELVESSPIVVSAEDISDVSIFIRFRDSKDHELENYQVLSVVYVKSTSGTLFCISHVVKASDKTEHRMMELFKSNDLSFEMPSFDTTDFERSKDSFSSLVRSNVIRSNLFFDKRNRAILALSANGDVKSVDVLRDSTRWSRRLFNDNDSFFTASPSRFGNLVMFGDWGGNLVGISSNDGSLLWLKRT